MSATSPDSAEPSAPAGQAARRIEEYVLGGVITVLGVFTLVDTASIVVPGSANTMGPRTFPYLVGGMLVVAGLAVVVATLRGRFGEAEEGEDVDAHARTDWRTVVLLVGFFLAQVVLIERIGWPLATAILFAGSAWTLGARPWWKPALIGVVLGLVLQVAFAGGLGLSLPAGLLEGVPFLDG